MSRVKQFLIRAFTRKPYSRVSLTVMAIEATRREQGKRQVDIAQVSELLRHILDQLAEECIDNPKGFAELLNNRVKQVQVRRKAAAWRDGPAAE